MEAEAEHVQRRRARLASSPTACIRSYCRIPSRRLKNSPRVVSHRLPNCVLLPQKEKEDGGMEKGKRGRNAHASLTLIGTPCNGPFKRPVSAKSASSLRASSLASLKNTTVRHSLRALQVQEKSTFTHQCDLDKLVGSSEWQDVRTLREAIGRLVCLRRAGDVSLQHLGSSPRAGYDVLHDL